MQMIMIELDKNQKNSSNIDDKCKLLYVYKNEKTNKKWAIIEVTSNISKTTRVDYLSGTKVVDRMMKRVSVLIIEPCIYSSLLVGLTFLCIYTHEISRTRVSCLVQEIVILFPIRHVCALVRMCAYRARIQACTPRGISWYSPRQNTWRTRAGAHQPRVQACIPRCISL